MRARRGDPRGAILTARRVTALSAPTSVASPVAAWVLAGATAAAMLVITGTPRDVAVVVLSVLQIGLHLLAIAARVVPAPSPWRRPAVLFSVQAGLTWLVAGEPTTTSALVYLGVALVFAPLAEVVLRLVGRASAALAGDEPERGDTAPLPVVGEPEH